MQDSFNAYRYFSFLLRRWMFVAIACTAAAGIALAVSLLLPSRYTATASIIIEPPPGNDPRVATAVSPVYLESLKTYEQFASSDSLFARALERFQLRRGDSDSFENLKRRILKVSKIRDTKILQVSATLNDPTRAHELAEFLAMETVNLSRTVARQADQQAILDSEKQLEAARARAAQAQSEWDKFAAGEPVDALEADIEAQTKLKAGADRDLLEAKAIEAEYAARANAAADRELGPLRARIAVLEKQSSALAAEIRGKSAMLARRQSMSGQLQTRLKTAETALETAMNRVRDLRAVTGFRSETLEVIDPGIVPQRPSSPNIPLNVFAAFFAALVASLAYLSVVFGYRNAKAEDFAAYRSAGRGDD